MDDAVHFDGPIQAQSGLDIQLVHQFRRDCGLILSCNSGNHGIILTKAKVIVKHISNSRNPRSHLAVCLDDGGAEPSTNWLRRKPSRE